MSKPIKFLQVFREAFYGTSEDKRSRTYLLVNSRREYHLELAGNDGIFKAKNFATKKEAQDYIRWQIPKADWEDWELYKKDDKGL